MAAQQGNSSASSTAQYYNSYNPSGGFQTSIREEIKKKEKELYDSVDTSYHHCFMDVPALFA